MGCGPPGSACVGGCVVCVGLFVVCRVVEVSGVGGVVGAAAAVGRAWWLCRCRVLGCGCGGVVGVCVVMW